MSTWNPNLQKFVQMSVVTAVVILAVFLFSLSLPGGAARAETIQPGPIFTVNNTADPGGAVCSVTSCSLRAAIAAANAGSLPGGYIIGFALTYPAEIVLDSELPVVTGTLTIVGPGPANLAISGAGQYRVFNVDSGATLALSGLTIRQGSNAEEGGGGIYNAGSLSINASTVSENLAGGGNGGGLLNAAGGEAVISATTFAENSGFHDGGISNSGTMTVTASLFISNTARVAGAINNAFDANLTVTSSTFSGNVAPISSGGALLNGGTLVVANSTFFNNGSPIGADIANGNTLHVTNSTFAGTQVPSLNSLANTGSGVTATLRNNILAAGEGIENCFSQEGAVLDADASNQATDDTCDDATPVTEAELLLGPLQDNGGSTPTMAPQAGSVAIDAGDDAVCVAAVGAPDFGAGGQDQRGVARPQGAQCDVGAVERLIYLLYFPLMAKDG